MNRSFKRNIHLPVYRLPLISKTSIKRFYCLLALVVCCLFALEARAESTRLTLDQETPIQLGLFPHLSNQLLIKKYRELIDYLESTLQRPVIVSSAPDFSIFTKRASEGRYDIYLTAPHLAAYHESHDHHQRLARFSREIRGLIVVADGSPDTRLEDLHGKKVSAADAIAVVTLLGEKVFADRGIKPHQDFVLKYSPSHTNALYSVAEGRVDAAIVGSPSYRIYTKSSPKKPLRILSKTDSIPHMMFMSASRVSDADTDVFKKALLSFSSEDDGKAFFAKVPFGDMTVISDQDMERLKDIRLLLEQRLER